MPGAPQSGAELDRRSRPLSRSPEPASTDAASRSSSSDCERRFDSPTPASPQARSATPDRARRAEAPRQGAAPARRAAAHRAGRPRAEARHRGLRPPGHWHDRLRAPDPPPALRTLRAPDKRGGRIGTGHRQSGARLPKRLREQRVRIVSDRQPCARAPPRPRPTRPARSAPLPRSPAPGPTNAWPPRSASFSSTAVASAAAPARSPLRKRASARVVSARILPIDDPPSAESASDLSATSRARSRAVRPDQGDRGEQGKRRRRSPGRRSAFRPRVRPGASATASVAVPPAVTRRAPARPAAGARRTAGSDSCRVRQSQPVVDDPPPGGGGRRQRQEPAPPTRRAAAWSGSSASSVLTRSAVARPGQPL